MNHDKHDRTLDRAAFLDKMAADEEEARRLNTQRWHPELGDCTTYDIEVYEENKRHHATQEVMNIIAYAVAAAFLIFIGMAMGAG